MSRSKKPVLPGLSRSAVCSKTACARLSGHNGDHRSTLKGGKSTADGWADRMPKDGKMQTAATHLRRASARRPKVRTLKEAGPEGRDVQTVGRAKRAKASPASSRSGSNAGALKGRMIAKPSAAIEECSYCGITDATLVAVGKADDGSIIVLCGSEGTGCLSDETLGACGHHRVCDCLNGICK